MALSLDFLISKMGYDFFLEVPRGTLQLLCRMMNERVSMKDRALRKSSLKAVIMQAESFWNPPGALEMSVHWATQTQVSLGAGGTYQTLTLNSSRDCRITYIHREDPPVSLILVPYGDGLERPLSSSRPGGQAGFSSQAPLIDWSCLPRALERTQGQGKNSAGEEGSN